MVKTTKEIGDEAERKAVKYLITLGFIILETNYRHGRSEIDIIAKKNNVIHIVEVKYRSNNSFGFPEEFVDKRKANMIGIAAEYYFNQTLWTGFVQYDIISLTNNEIQHFEDAF